MMEPELQPSPLNLTFEEEPGLNDESEQTPEKETGKVETVETTVYL